MNVADLINVNNAARRSQLSLCPHRRSSCFQSLLWCAEVIRRDTEILHKVIEETVLLTTVERLCLGIPDLGCLAVLCLHDGKREKNE